MPPPPLPLPPRLYLRKWHFDGRHGAAREPPAAALPPLAGRKWARSRRLLTDSSRPSIPLLTTIKSRRCSSQFDEGICVLLKSFRLTPIPFLSETFLFSIVMFKKMSVSP